MEAASLDGRKGRILRAIVNEYVETGDPVGSEWLAARHDFGCKSATLRNEMAEMSDLGYLLQPHTSAGRIPSDRGYRYYVDRLMPPPAVPEQNRPVALPPEQAARTPVEEILLHTCRMLATITSYPSMATAPAASGTTLHRIYLSRATERRVLAVLLLSTGRVEHRLVETVRPVSARGVERAASFLNEQLGGREVREVAHLEIAGVPGVLAPEEPLIRGLFAVVVEAARALEEDRVLLEGTSHLLRQREFQDIHRLETLLGVLEQRSLLCQVFSHALDQQAVTVMIGSECGVAGMQDCSVVTSPYRIGDRARGFIGVVGPTRMRYEAAAAAVLAMARDLSALLSKASLE